MTFDLVVRSGLLVDADGETHADIAITDGCIAAVGPALGPGAVEIDARGSAVIPGGVDSHVHLGQLSSKGDMTADDFWTGSRSAAHGGTTTVVPFAAQHRGMSIAAVVEDAMSRAAAEMTVDYGMHCIITDWTEAARSELAAAASEGLTAVKIYLTYDRLKVAGDEALSLVRTAAGLGLPVMIHAEDDALVSNGRREMVEAGRFGAASHAHSHSREAEWSGVRQAIELAAAGGATAYLAHVSTPEAIDMAVRARERGVEVVTETCPHYLLLDEARYDAPIEVAAPFLCSPPLRGDTERMELLRRLAGGDIDIVSSDHSPYTIAQKLPDGPATKFTQSANGLPGVELRMALLYTAGVASGHLAMSQFVELTAAAPARLCGIYPRKGSLEVGADADLVIWDDAGWAVGWDRLHDNVGYTPYEGFELAGRPRVVIARGDVIVDDAGADGTRPGRGRFIARG